MCVYFICSSDTDLVTSFVVFYFYTNLGKSTHIKTAHTMGNCVQSETEESQKGVLLCY